jgi:hypothetical protein
MLLSHFKTSRVRDLPLFVDDSGRDPSDPADRWGPIGEDINGGP